MPDDTEIFNSEEDCEEFALSAEDTFAKVTHFALLLKIIPAIKLKLITPSDFIILIGITDHASRNTYRIHTNATALQKSLGISKSSLFAAFKRLINAGFLGKFVDSKGRKYFVVNPDVVSCWNNPGFYLASKKEIENSLRERQGYAIQNESKTLENIQ